MTSFLSADNSGIVLGAPTTITLYGGDVAISQTNLVIAAVKAPFALIPLSLEICNRASANSPTIGLYNSTDSTEIFANLATGASGVPVRTTTVVATNAVVQKGDTMQVRATTGGTATATGAQVVLTCIPVGDPDNR